MDPTPRDVSTRYRDEPRPPHRLALGPHNERGAMEATWDACGASRFIYPSTRLTAAATISGSSPGAVNCGSSASSGGSNP